MPSAPLAEALLELIDELLAAESISARKELIKHTAELGNRAVIIAIADAVNRIAREDLPRAERLAEVTCWVAEHSGDLFCRARIHRAAGNLHVLRGKHAEAIQVFDTCIEQFTAISEEIEVAATLSGSLQPLIYLGRYSEALERAREARAIAERHQDALLLARLDINVGTSCTVRTAFPKRFSTTSALLSLSIACVKDAIAPLRRSIWRYAISL